MKVNIVLILLCFFVGLGTANVLCQDSPAEWQLLEGDSIIELSLVLDLDSLLADIGEDPSYHDAILSYVDPRDKTQAELNIKVRARGSFRKDPDNCDFPPLKLKFNKTERQGSIFEDMKDLKMVTHCQSDKDEFEQYVLQEYLIYKAYNIFTDYSFRVRLVRITYIDLPSRTDSLTRFAFLLEDGKDMAERNEGELLGLKSVPYDKLDQHHFALMCMFNYMMLNTDYSIPIVHNVKLVSIDHFKPPIPVPYDFDWSGIINIPYDSPFAKGTSRFPDRRYKGPCIKRKERQMVFTEMIAGRESLYKLYSDFPYLHEDMRARSLQELRMFYIILGSQELVRQEFKKDCIE